MNPSWMPDESQAGAVTEPEAAVPTIGVLR